MPKRDQLVGFRVDGELRERIRRHKARLEASAPALRVAEADALRDLVLQGLATVETLASPGPKPKKRRAR